MKAPIVSRFRADIAWSLDQNDEYLDRPRPTCDPDEGNAFIPWNSLAVESVPTPASHSC